jgi:hypothetical protein
MLELEPVFGQLIWVCLSLRPLVEKKRKKKESKDLFEEVLTRRELNRRYVS